MKAKTWIGAALVVIVAGLLAVVLWPAPDPLARAETVAIRPPDWEAQNQAIRGPFTDGLTVTLGNRNVRIVADPAHADAVLAVQGVRIHSLELRLESGEISGRASAFCQLTERATGKAYPMDFTLELKDGTIRASLVSRKFWQFWKRG